ncbi:MAG: SIR2 family protein [Bacteroidota bacterium]
MGGELKDLEKYTTRIKSRHHKVYTFIDSFQQKFREDTDKIKRLHSDFDFEHRLSLIASHFGIKAVREKIKELYDHRYYPCLIYEIIAHLLRHRFLDAVINFNFDELLDQAIMEEVQSGDHKFILSDGDCRNMNDLIIKDGMNVPLYIKPHGTVSHKSTMRFTKDDYFGIPRDLQNFLEEFVSGKLKFDDGKEYEGFQISKVNLIFIGFEMGSVEFNQIIEKAVKSGGKRSEFHFHLFEYNEKQSTGEGSSKKDRLFNNLNKEIIQRLPNGNNPEQVFRAYTAYVNDDDPLEKRFLKIVELLDKQFTDTYKPRGIWRNKIICALFHDQIRKERMGYKPAVLETEFNKKIVEDENLRYFEIRVYMEIIISLAINKGTVLMDRMINGRSGMYHSLYRELKGVDGRSLIDFVHELGLQRDPNYARGIYIDNKVKSLLYDGASKKIISKLRAVTKILFKKIVKIYPKTILKKDQIEIKESLFELLKRNNYSINPQYSARRFSLLSHFKKDNILNTRISMRVKLNSLVQGQSWDRLFIVATRGNLLFRNLYSNPELVIPYEKWSNVELILTDDVFHKLFENKIKVRYIPYYGMEFYMAFTMKWLDMKKIDSIEQPDWTVDQAIYFPISQESNVITPFFIDNSKIQVERDFFPQIFWEYLAKSSVNTNSFKEYRHLNPGKLQLGYEKWLKSMRSNQVFDLTEFQNSLN